MKKNNIDVYDGTGKLTGQSVQVSLKRRRRRGGAPATSSSPPARVRAPCPAWSSTARRIISYIEAILSEELPKKLIVIGGGVIGVEFAYMWANYGVEVTIVEMLPHLLPNEEPEVSKVLEKAYKKFRREGASETPFRK
jgi:dihydrolipoamide dehydrogenase